MNSEFQTFLNASRKVDDLVHKAYPKGLVMKWIGGPYKGRECFIREVIWEEDFRNRGTINIMMVVTTRSRDGKGWMNDNDSFHRQFRGVRYFEAVK